MAVDEWEFQEFFASQYGPLCWLGYLLTGNRAEAEDLAQDALVRTYFRWARVRRPDDPATDARRVLVNRHRSLVRRALVEARHRAVTGSREGYVPEFGEDAMAVWAAARKLPRRQQLVLALRYHEDLPEAEVARLLRLPLGTVKSLARRGLARLRAELGPSPSRPLPARAVPAARRRDGEE
jgi:RNA polymerase sigma-70 factor (sigma-E family)